MTLAQKRARKAMKRRRKRARDGNTCWGQREGARHDINIPDPKASWKN